MRLALAALAAILSFSFDRVAARTIFAEAFEQCGSGTNPPPSASAACRPIRVEDIDPQGTDIWIRGRIELDDPAAFREPLGLFVSAKASSEVYFNGVRLGSNGAPAPRPDLETPGRMDAVFAVPERIMRVGENTVSVRFSSHRGYLRLDRPVHWIALGPYASPVSARLAYMWPSLIPFGIFIAGALYFGIVSITAERRRDPALLAILSLSAALQLGVEISRAIVAYPYPIHDLRLIAIVATSAGFSSALIALVISRFVATRKTAIFFGVVGLMAVAILFSDGFDAKAGFALLTAVIASAAISLHAAWRGDRQGLLYAAALSTFGVSILAFRAAFLDAAFFFEVAALLLILFAVQAVALERERRESALERARAHELEAALQRASEHETPAVVKVNAAGSVTLIHAAEITHCRGAGDYVELHLADRRSILHNGTLAQLENELPPTFLRVHRSYVVNTSYVRTLSRESSGVGAVNLSNGAEVPVSRRIMPRVREALV